MTACAKVKPLRAFHNRARTKQKYLNRVRRHREADRLIQGQGWEADEEGEEGGSRLKRGCAVGCTLEAYDHSRYPIELGIPLQIAHLEDRIFEGLSPRLAQQWPEQFLSAIPVGADLSKVWPSFAVWLLSDDYSPMYEASRHPKVVEAIEAVADLYRRQLLGASVAAEEFEAAREACGNAASRCLSYNLADAANDAAANAADAAAYAAAADAAAANAADTYADYAAYAANYAANSATSAANAAAYAAANDAAAAAYAAYAADAAAARRKAYIKMRNKLLSLLRTCK